MVKFNIRKKKINEMKNNIVIGVYYYASDLDEYFLGSEMISDPNWNERDNNSNRYIGTQVFSVKNSNVIVPIGESYGPCEQYKRYITNSNNNEQNVIAVSKDIDWEKLSNKDIDYIYDLYCQYLLLEKRKVQEMENNNVVMGVYYYASDLDEYFLGSEMISDPNWNERAKNYDDHIGAQAFSIKSGDVIVPIGESHGPYKQYERYIANSNSDYQNVIAVSKKIDWEKLNTNDIDYVYELYCQYNNVKEHSGYQKVK